MNPEQMAPYLKRNLALGHLVIPADREPFWNKAMATAVPVYCEKRYWLWTAEHFMSLIPREDLVIAFFPGEQNTVGGSVIDVFRLPDGLYFRGYSPSELRDGWDCGFIYVSNPYELTRRGYEWTLIPEEAHLCPLVGQAMLASGYPGRMREYKLEEGEDHWHLGNLILGTRVLAVHDRGFDIGYRLRASFSDKSGPVPQLVSGMSGGPVWFQPPSSRPLLAGLVQSQCALSGTIEARNISLWHDMVVGMIRRAKPGQDADLPEQDPPHRTS